MSETELLERIKQTLKQHSERFISGREIKRDLHIYALRISGPPLLPNFKLNADDVLCDDLLTEKLNLKLLDSRATANTTE